MNDFVGLLTIGILMLLAMICAYWLLNTEEELREKEYKDDDD